jgi:hypothetical protein
MAGVHPFMALLDDGADVIIEAQQRFRHFRRRGLHRG